MKFMEHITIIETVLRDRRKFFTEIRQFIDVREKIQSLLISSFIFLAVYGAVMGAAHSLPQAGINIIKLPLLFLATLAICTPSLHFFNILFGSKQTLSQTIALILTAIGTTSVILFSLAPVTFFFLTTTTSYPFFKMLNVVFFVIAGAMGVTVLQQGMQIVTEREDGAEGIKTRRIIFIVWFVLYGFVGSQMAWTLRPFLHSPAEPFVLFSERASNFYADVVKSAEEIIKP